MRYCMQCNCKLLTEWLATGKEHSVSVWASELNGLDHVLLKAIIIYIHIVSSGKWYNWSTEQNAGSCPQGTNNVMSWILCLSPQPGILHYRCPQCKRHYNVQPLPQERQQLHWWTARIIQQKNAWDWQSWQYSAELTQCYHLFHSFHSNF